MALRPDLLILAVINLLLLSLEARLLLVELLTREEALIPYKGETRLVSCWGVEGVDVERFSTRVGVEEVLGGRL